MIKLNGVHVIHLLQYEYVSHLFDSVNETTTFILTLDFFPLDLLLFLSLTLDYSRFFSDIFSKPSKLNKHLDFVCVTFIFSSSSSLP